jgi:hypothetical protein
MGIERFTLSGPEPVVGTAGHIATCRLPARLPAHRRLPAGNGNVDLSQCKIRRASMETSKIAALAFVVAGILALAYGGFTYTKETHTASIGSLELSMDEKRRVNIPMWAGIGAIVLGGVLFIGVGRAR